MLPGAKRQIEIAMEVGAGQRSPVGLWLSPAGSALGGRLRIDRQIEIALEAGGSVCAIGGWLPVCAEGWMLPHATCQIVIANGAVRVC